MKGEEDVSPQPKKQSRRRVPQPPVKVTFIGLTPEVIMKAQRALYELWLEKEAQKAAAK